MLRPLNHLHGTLSLEAVGDPLIFRWLRLYRAFRQRDFTTRFSLAIWKFNRYPSAIDNNRGWKMGSAFSKFCAGLACCLLGSAFASAQARPGIDGQTFQAVSPGGVVKLASADGGLQKTGISTEQAIYLVRLEDAPVASYRGDIAGLRATSPQVTGEAKLNGKSPAAQAYRQFLADRHAELVLRMHQSLGRIPKVAFEYFHGNNGMAVWLTAAEAQRVRQFSGVAFVQRDMERKLHTDAGPAWIGAEPVWSGLPGLSPTQGEGIVVGIIDTGINPSNPSFADIGPVDGYDHNNPWGAGSYVGVCDTGDPSYDPTFPCNDKLIGAWGYPDVNGGDPRDNDSHGSHTASTSAGNRLNISVDAPTISVPASISGVAPHANIVAYAACCTLSALTAAIDQAILDGVDVINYSIGSSSPSSVWADFDTVGFRNARTAGIFVAVSAGNDGPGPDTVGSPADAPWLTAVGNSTHDRTFENELINMSGGDTSAPADMLGQSVTSGFGPAPIIHASTLGDAQCLTPFAAGICTGQIVVCDRGTIDRVEKGTNVLACGAGGLVLANVDAQGESIAGDSHFLPAVHVGDTNGDTLRAWLSSGAGHMASIAGTIKVNDPANGDIMSATSSRGANRALPDIVKPDVTAPGSNILAVVGVGDPNPPEYGFKSGTSMASPHVAGAAALFKALYPTLTPAEVQSVFTTTGTLSMHKEDAATPADPFDMGGGRINVDTAAVAALVLDETGANYITANPATGGDPKALNLATMGNQVCPGACSWTRTVRSVAPGTVDVAASPRNPPGWILTPTPANFTIMPGATQVITINASAVAVPGSDWSFGGVTLTPSVGPVQDLPVAIAFDAPPGAGGSYAMSTSLTNPGCDTGFGGYVDLESFGIFPNSGITGDTGSWTAFSGQDPIQFYGGSFTGISFTDDGFAFFDSTPGTTPWAPQLLPDPADPNSVMAMLWDDFEIVYDGTPGGVRGVSLATATTDVSIIEYDDLEPYPAGSTADRVDFEVVVRSAIDDTPGVYEIVFAYDNVVGNLPAVATVGLEAPGASDAVPYLNQEDAAGLSNGLMICFDYQAGCQDYWTLNSGTVSAPETYNARKAIFAGDAFTVSAGGELALNTAAGGSVHFYPGFGVADTGMLTVNTSAAVCP